MFNFKVGDRVYVKRNRHTPYGIPLIDLPDGLIGRHGTVLDVYYYEDSDPTMFLPDALVELEGGTKAWIEMHHLEPVELNKQQENDMLNASSTYVVASVDDSQLTPQALRVLDHLKKVGHITNVEAHMVLKCRSVSRRITELRDAGYPIRREFKKDSQGQRYARYSLA